MKKLLLILLIAMLCFAGCEATESQIQEAIGTEGLQYEKTEDGTGYIVTGYIGSEKDVIIPENYNSAPVVRINEVAFRQNDTIESISIPSSVTIIGEQAFKNCKKLTAVKLNEGLKEIGVSAFMGSGVEQLVVPKSVTLIDTMAFAKCFNLRYIKFENEMTEIGDNAFYDSKYFASFQNWSKSGLYINNTLVKMPTDTYPDKYTHQIGGTTTTRSGVAIIAKDALENNRCLAHVVISEGTTTFRGRFANNCERLESITLPSTLEYIGEKFVSKCKEFSTINYSGTKEQWEKIEKHPEWDIDMKSYVIHCSDGDIEVQK